MEVDDMTSDLPLPAPVTEDHFTYARADMPHPEWWHATDGESTEIEVTELVAAFVRALQPEFVVETGAAWGQTTEAIGAALQRNGHGELVSLEIIPERVRYTRGRCAGLPVLVVSESSMDYTPSRPVDFAWLDSELELRAWEARRLRPYLREGSIIGVHDTGSLHGIRPALDDLTREGWLRPIYLRSARGVAFMEVLREGRLCG